MRSLFDDRGVSFLNRVVAADHAACGVAMMVNIPQVNNGNDVAFTSHQTVVDGLTVLANFAYRSGYNYVTGESDGAGIKLFGLPTPFFQKKINQNEFHLRERGLEKLILQENKYVIGQYFIPRDLLGSRNSKRLVETKARENGLRVVAWRNLESAVNIDIISSTARQKMPEIWQAILLPLKVNQTKNTILLEQRAINTTIAILHEIKTRNLDIHVLSQSSEAIVYKGMLKPEQLGHFFKDLQDEDFTAKAYTVHSRFATNTAPQWKNAQPCVFFLAHNGELNSAPANAAEMVSELKINNFKGVYPDAKLSDSMQLDVDLANQISCKNIRLDEAFIRLLSAPTSKAYSPEVRAMLDYFSLERTPYNGPAFIVAASSGYFIAKLDTVGLRPSRWALIEDKEGRRQFHAASDDYITIPHGGKIIQKSHLEPGGMIMITPQGNLLTTEKILQGISQRYLLEIPNYFQTLLKRTLFQLETSLPTTPPINFRSNPNHLNRVLYSAGWDYETVEQVVRYMAENGMEKTAAMGDDTNPLSTFSLPAHLSYFFHQLFAQVSAPPIDSIKERTRFSLSIRLGAAPGQIQQGKQLAFNSPFLSTHEINGLEKNTIVNTLVLSITFEIPLNLSQQEVRHSLMTMAIQDLLKKAEKFARKGGVIILSDRHQSASQLSIPDLLAVAAVRRHLEACGLDRRVSLVVDSYQIHGPHQAAVLLAFGATALYTRGAYSVLNDIYGQQQINYSTNYVLALQKCLLKIMGKMGITDVNNYINGHLIAALGLDLSPTAKTLFEQPSLGNIFPRIYSPLKGFTLAHITDGIFTRHQQAYNPDNDFTLLPRSGYYMPEKGGIKHSYGPEVVQAFSTWMKEENLKAISWQMHLILARKGYNNFIDNLDEFSVDKGFLDPCKKDENQGFYPPKYLEQFKPSIAFQKMCKKIDEYRLANPTAIHDYFSIHPNASNKMGATNGQIEVQSQQSIRKLLFSGSMSQGALTVTDPNNPQKTGAHETLTRGINAVGANSASGEGGEAPNDLANPLTTTTSKQIASGRFGVSAKQISYAQEMEIKIAQGAKPGEGGELPGTKVSIRFAAQRGGLPGTNFISPPPHHDIYSIEDLAQLIYDIKSVNPQCKVTVKLVASLGIGTIAAGVAKAGADVINIASNSGGTGASPQSSIKHAGLPAEIGLVEVDKALRITQLRDLVQLRVSGGFKTPEEIIIAAILGADSFELGTTAMLTLGCKMQRTCNHSCQPGVATDGHLFKGEQINTERYFVNLAAGIQERLKELKAESLYQLRGRTDLLLINQPEITKIYDFSLLLNRDELVVVPDEMQLAQALIEQQIRDKRPKEDRLSQEIKDCFAENPSYVFCNQTSIELTSQDLSFGARLAGNFTNYLEKNPNAGIKLHTMGIAGQSFACFLPKGLSITHTGTVQDGCAKSMTGGELILRTIPPLHEKAHEHTIAGNAMLYGASGGKVFVNGIAGHRFGILMKGAQVVVEGVGDLAFEYMTSGTGLIIGQVGADLGVGALGGILFIYAENNANKISEYLRIADAAEKSAYEHVVFKMLKEHAEKTQSVRAGQLLTSFNMSHFNVLIPKELDKVDNLTQVINIIKTYQLRQAPLTGGMQVWLEQKILSLLETVQEEEKLSLKSVLATAGITLFSASFLNKAHQILSGILLNPFNDKLACENSLQHLSLNESIDIAKKPKTIRLVEERLSSIHGVHDEILMEALQHISVYAAALTKDAQGCSSCRAQSCSWGDKVETGCPGGKGINTINTILKRLGTIADDNILTLQQWKILREAFAVQIQETPFIAYTGAACPAPCQDACTETIPNLGKPNLQRGGKPVGEPVQIKEIEYYLYLVGRALGWFNGKKQWSSAEIQRVFGSDQNKNAYDQLMKTFQVPFRKALHSRANKELIIVGSGPAAMQIAYEALLDGVRVSMYEKSDKPGGLLVDGIPAHKFDKAYLQEDFEYLKSMGLQLYLNAEVEYDASQNAYRIKNDITRRVIAYSDYPNQYVVLCVGAGLPKTLPSEVTAKLSAGQSKKVIQAVDFLKAANDLSQELKKHPDFSGQDQEKLIKHYLGDMDPRNKKIVVIGGGDTAQDVIRWVARYFSALGQGELEILRRGPKLLPERKLYDSYPNISQALTLENQLRDQEVEYVQGCSSYLIEPLEIIENEQGKLTVTVKESKYKYHEQIHADAQLLELHHNLPRHMRPIELNMVKQIEQVDLVICALGFCGKESIPLVQAIEANNLQNVFIAGDAAGVEELIIIGAQANASNTYGQIQRAMGIVKNNTGVIKPDLFFNKKKDEIYNLNGINYSSSIESDNNPINIRL